MSGATVKNFAAYETIPLLTVANTSVSAVFKLPGSWELSDVMISNNGSTVAFVNFGRASNGAVTAQTPATTGTLGATPILPGQTMVLSKDEIPQSDTCAAFSTGASQLYFTSGIGN